MSVNFLNEDHSIRKLREALAAMSDEELIKVGKQLRRLTTPKRVSHLPNPFEKQLEVAKEEWLRRHPRKSTDESRNCT
jgi:hypothetical protein